MTVQDKNQMQEPEFPWFIRKFKGHYIMLFRDFESITGVHLSGNYTAWKREFRLVGGRDYNGYDIGECTAENKERFKEEYGFEYGDESRMMYYLYFNGITKALEIGKNEINHEAHKIITEAIKQIRNIQEARKMIDRNINYTKKMAEHDHRLEIAKKVALVLSENRAKVEDLSDIFILAQKQLSVSILPDSEQSQRFADIL